MGSITKRLRAPSLPDHIRKSILGYWFHSLRSPSIKRHLVRSISIGAVLSQLSTVNAAEPAEAPPPVQLEGPDITLIEADDRAIFEYRMHGRLTMVRIVPDIGNPYYLVPKDPTQGWDDLERADGLVPQWVLFRF